jgi:hypothetical protein
VSGSDPKNPGGKGEFKQDFAVDKPGIVGARWWHQGLQEEDRQVSRRQALLALGVGGGAIAALSAIGVGVAVLANRKEKTGLASRQSLVMQKTYGWDFGARGVALVFNGQAEGPFVRSELAKLPAVMTPGPGPNAKYQVPTLLESLMAQPTETLPDPEDGLPRPDGAPFRRLADVVVPIVTPEMRQAYAAGEALARSARGRSGLAVLADMPGPLAVAFAAGAADSFEPVMLTDNWPHPHGVVPSHLTLAALAYYQPRFAAARSSRPSPPLFVLDRQRLAAYTEDSQKFDNRYYARMASLAALAKDGVTTLVYAVAAPTDLPEPDDLNGVLSARPAATSTTPAVDVRAVALTDFRSDPAGRDPSKVFYGGSTKSEVAFWGPSLALVSSSPTAQYQFAERRPMPRPAVGLVPVMIATTSGLVLAAALDRRGSMNRFAGGWSG